MRAASAGSVLAIAAVLTGCGGHSDGSGPAIPASTGTASTGTASTGTASTGTASTGSTVSTGTPDAASSIQAAVTDAEATLNELDREFQGD